VRKRYPESLLEFEHWFRTDEACRNYLFELRWPEGFTCPLCANRGAWTMSGHLFRCQTCRRDVSVTADTIFHRSRLPLRTWFRIVWWATNQKSGLSALGLQRMLGLGSYQTAWTCLQKLRRAMIRPDRERLNGPVELDETSVGGHRRGSKYNENKASVVIAVEVKGAGIGRVRIRRISKNATGAMLAFVEKAVVPGATIITDGEWAFGLLAAMGFKHQPTVLRGRGKEASKAVLPRVHRVASLMKRWLLGTHQGRINPDTLDPYLDEFTFRFNRRNSPHRGMLFYKLLQQCVAYGPSTYQQITTESV
jgi:transposase-like protein